MAFDKNSVKDALLDARLNMSQRAVYGWLLLELTKRGDSITIAELAEAFCQNEVTTGAHLNALERHGILDRFLPGGGKAPHHWRLCAQ
jgi:predicted DNA-binding transcriptional regulator